MTGGEVVVGGMSVLATNTSASSTAPVPSGTPAVHTLPEAVVEVTDFEGDYEGDAPRSYRSIGAPQEGGPWNHQLKRETNLTSDTYESNRFSFSGALARNCTKCGRDIQLHRSVRVVQLT